MQVDKLDTRACQNIADQAGMATRTDFAQAEHGLTPGVEYGQSVPAAPARHIAEMVVHPRHDRVIMPAAGEPLAEQYRQPRIGRKIRFGIDPRFGEVVFDLLTLLLGDDHKRALGLAADLPAQVAIADGADQAHQQRYQHERQHESQP